LKPLPTPGSRPWGFFVAPPRPAPHGSHDPTRLRQSIYAGFHSFLAPGLRSHHSASPEYTSGRFPDRSTQILTKSNVQDKIEGFQKLPAPRIPNSLGTLGRTVKIMAGRAVQGSEWANQRHMAGKPEGAVAARGAGALGSRLSRSTLCFSER
jgi:hypothetical protein